MLNAAMSPTFYEFDSGDLLKLYREMDDNDEEPVIVYHSHTATEAYPSRTDISLAGEPGAHYVRVSTRDGAHESGTVDFVCTDMPTAQAAVQAYPDLKILAFSANTCDNFKASDEDVNIGIGLRKGNTVLKDALNKVLGTMTADDFNKLMAEAIKVQPKTEG